MATITLTVGILFSSEFNYYFGIIAFSFFVLGIIIYMRQDIWRPAEIILIITPFQGVLTTIYGYVANVFTLIPIIVFLTQIPDKQFYKYLLGSRVQRLTALFIVTLTFSFLFSLRKFDVQILVDYAQKVTLFFLLAVFTASFQKIHNISRLLWILILSMSVFIVLSLADFYFGLHLIRHYGAWGDPGLLGELRNSAGIVNTTYIHNYRLYGIGGMISINRLSNWLILPIFAALGCLLITRQKLTIIIAGAFLLILSYGLIASSSRGSLLGFIIACVVILFVLRNRISNRIIMLFMILGIAGILFVKFGMAEILTFRFTGSELTDLGRRYAMWQFGIELFLRSPLFGAGANGFINNAPIGLLNADPHSAVIELLSQRGIFCMVSFLVLVIHVSYILFRKIVNIPRNLAIWKNIFLGSWIGILISNVFATYHYERLFWVVIGFAAFIEHQFTNYNLPKKN